MIGGFIGKPIGGIEVIAEPTQILTPSLFTNTQTLFSPQVNLKIYPGLFTNTSTFNTHSLVGAQLIQDNPFIGAQIFYSPLIGRIFTTPDSVFKFGAEENRLDKVCPFIEVLEGRPLPKKTELQEQREQRKEAVLRDFEEFIKLVQPKRWLGNIHREVIRF